MVAPASSSGLTRGSTSGFPIETFGNDELEKGGIDFQGTNFPLEVEEDILLVEMLYLITRAFRLKEEIQEVFGELIIQVKYTII